MATLFFTVSFTAGMSIFLLAFIALFSKKYQFWPPPESGSWQHKLFLFLFRLMFYCLVLLSFFDYNTINGVNEELRFALSLPLLLIGFGTAFYLTFYMGWKNAFGEKRGLITSGLYNYSRNPVYVVSIVGMLGWGILADSFLVYIILTLWATMYLLAPFIEEPWLEQSYGKAFISYKSKVSRFIGLRN